MHPSYYVTSEEQDQMHEHDWQKILDLRKAHNERKRNVRAATSNIIPPAVPQLDAATIISALTNHVNGTSSSEAASRPGDYTITISQANTQGNGTVMGGRNEESSRRGRINLSHVSSIRNEVDPDLDTRHVRSARHSSPKPGIIAANECDSNADTCCAGTNFVVLRYTHRTANVYPYDTSYKPITNVPIVTAATAWTNPLTDETVILVLNECLYYGAKLPHTLWNPNQLRYHGATVNDNPFDASEDRMSIQVEDVVIPLESCGTKVQFFTHTPTQQELDDCRHVELTNDHPWNPREVYLHPAAATPHKLSCVRFELTHDPFLTDVSPALVELKERALSHVRVSSTSN